ncbi:hypothetical protein BS47DRAFT_1370366 [Hydnum rufescens UP504]|uniref:Ras protein n=1 Tax=Hydnum rufescens UP504 TaxID=1448309 RepID=A0A9P6BBT1_9AGAM|nr:hypothetical protein BS47DRAFT_1370366 [Hydnum rufescens UP504]
MDRWRVAILGDGAVGKTALAVQLTPPINCLTETYDPTIEDSYRKQIVVDEQMCFIEVIDTAGQEEYATLRDQWVREGQGFILVYSVTSRRTFERLDLFFQSMRRVKRAQPIFMLVGNKIDQNARQVSFQEGKSAADRFGCEFVETSAKTAYQVDRAFTDLVRTLRRQREVDAGMRSNKQKRRPKKGGGPNKCIIS